MRKIKKKFLKLVLFITINLLSIVTAFWIHTITSKKPNLVSSSKQYIRKKEKVIRDKVLGYKPKPNQKGEFYKKTSSGELVWRINMNINEIGQRHIPRENIPETAPCIIFFGGSNTFGLGLNDNETLTYFTQTKSKNKYQVYDFSYGGYGPNHMLAILENDLIQKKVKCEAVLGVYRLYIFHINRVSGTDGEWLVGSPNYQIDSKGSLYHAGYFEEDLHKRKNIFSKTQYKEIDIKRTIAVFQKSKEIFQKKFPKSKIHVLIFCSTRNKAIKEITSGFNSFQIKHTNVTSFIPDYWKNYKLYKISKHDLHDNALVNKITASYILENLL